MEKSIAAIVVTAMVLESILPQHAAPVPHTEIDSGPLSSARDSASIDGSRLNDGIKLTLIQADDLVTLPHNGRHLSLKEIRAEADKQT
jgi:hypothetical protein